MIEVNHLVKSYGKYQAVNDISFKVEKGEVLGFLGPNGAGKSTTMNVITGYLSATSGEVKIAGCDILEHPKEAKKHIGYLPEIPPVYGDMTVLEYLSFVAELKGVKKAERKAMLTDIMDRIKISHVSGKLIKTLSKGYRQRVGLAQALVGYPDVLILDEPSVGLDPKQIMEMREVISQLGKDHTIILSSHILSEISAVCNRVMILNQGKIVASDTPERLSNRLGQQRYLVRLKGEKEQILARFGACPDFTQVEEQEQVEDGTTELLVTGKDGLDARETIFRLAVEGGFVLLLCKSDKMTLEEIFLRLTEGENWTEEADPTKEGEPQEENPAKKEEEHHEGHL